MKYKSTHIKGKGRGEDLGFPTINLEIPKVFVSKVGVYAGWVYLENKKLPAAIHFGPSPVFLQEERSLEIHVIDNKFIDISNEITFSINRYIRPVLNFKTKEELVAQIELDVNQIKEILYDL